MSKQTKSAKSTKSTKKVESDAFISEESLGSGDAAYLKFEKGANAFRIISKPITGWVDWVEDEDENRKPVRTPLSDGEPEASSEDQKPKKFVAFVVIDRADGVVKILELTQQSIIKGIKTLAENPKWGNPFSYDINVEKTGEKLKTKYAVTPSPKEPLSKLEIADALERPCNLEKLMDGENPWEVEEGEETEYIFK